MAIYHLTVKTGSRQGGQSAAAKVDYIEREGKYRRDPSEVLHSESGNMPAFAQHDHRAYWQAADLHERANGRLFKEVEFALPVELSLDQQRQLAHDFAQHLTGEHRLPYTLAIHRGDGTNPHCHLVISERQTDEHQRTAAQHFARYNAKQPDQGGARKTDALKPKEWLAQVRADWAERANAALEQAGHSQRIDHRSLEAQGITDRLPTQHIGPAALGYEQRTGEQSRRRIDIQGEQQAALERLQAAKAAGEELRAAESIWARSALDLRALEREREAMIERATTVRDALFERYRAGAEAEKNIELAKAYGLGITPETAAQAEQLQRQVDSRMRSLDEIDAKRAAEAAAPKPTLAELIQQPQRAPEPAPKVDRSGTDLGQLLAQGERVTAPPSPSVAPQAQPEPAPALTLGQHQAVIERRIKERTEAIGREREAKATAPARERLQAAQERLQAGRQRIQGEDRQAFGEASAARTAQRTAEAEAKRLAGEAEQWRAAHWMQTKLGRTGPADDLDRQAEQHRRHAQEQARKADEAEARREALAREERQLEREVEQAERGVEAARQEARRKDQGLDGYTAARQVIDEYRRDHPDYAQQADQRAAQERERREAEEAQREADRQAQREQQQDRGRSM